MVKRAFKIYEDSLQQRFQQSRAKIQVFAGGFANGKTANAVIKGLQLCKDYPGSNGLIARSTYPKLNDTIRKEFIKWCPKDWIKRFPTSKNSDNTCVMKNNTEVNFRYVQQQGAKQDSATSNLLSANYDWIIVDQMDDPEFSFKDFLDLLGRLRGTTTYVGNDPTMPSDGPRYIIVTCNPTRNWLYKQIIKPLHIYQSTGRASASLKQLMDAFGTDSLDGLLELFEGSTYENKDNISADYIRTLEGLYTGSMRERFLMGGWGAYEGLVYPMFNEETHVISHAWAEQYLANLLQSGFDPTILESLDYGLAVPMCYEFAFCDHVGNIIILDGFYKKEASIGETIDFIHETRYKYLGVRQLEQRIFADPAIFRRGAGDKKVVGRTISNIFHDDGKGVSMQRGNNEILNGIIKVQGYLNPQRFHRHVVNGDYPAPYLYVTDKCQWWIDEATDYYWKKDTSSEYEDVPRDKNDHAMDGTKYLLSRHPSLSKFLMKVQKAEAKRTALSHWQEQSMTPANSKAHRYARKAA